MTKWTPFVFLRSSGINIFTIAVILLVYGCAPIPENYQCDKPGGGVFFGVLCDKDTGGAA